MQNHEVEVVFNGTSVTGFDTYAINTDFLTPCSGWSLTLGGMHKWKRFSHVIVKDARVQIMLDGVQVMQGWVDRTRSSGDAERYTVSIEGRDHLKPLVKANVHPNTVIKELTIADAVLKVLKQVYRQDVPILIFDNDANRKVLTRAKKSKKGKPIDAKKQIEQLQPQSGEGAWEFLARLLRRNGLWMWPTVDGNLIVGKPNYDQAPNYTLQRLINDTPPVSYVTDVSVTLDNTNVPSHVFVVGKGGGKGEAASVIQGRAVDDSWVLWAPSYIKHDEVKDAKEASNIAWQELGRHKQNEFVYECTVKGHRDESTGAYYAIDTVAHVRDEIESIDADLYVTSCTWQRSTSQTTTKLKLVPLHSLVFEEEDKP